MIKRVLLILPLLFLAAFLAAVFFISRSDPDQYRPQIESYLEHHLRQTVELGPLSVEWRGIHPTLKFQNLTLKNKADQMLVQSKEVRGAVRLSGILLHQIVIDRLILEDAHFSVIRQESGNWNWDFSRDKGTGGRTRAVAGWKIKIETFEAQQASIYYADRSQLPYFHKEWVGLDIRLILPDSEAGLFQIVPAQGALLKKLDFNLISPYQLVIRGDFGVYGTGEGEIRNPFQEARFSLKTALQEVSLEGMGLKGVGSLQMEAFGEGVHPESLKRNLILKGDIHIQNGSILSRNFPGEILKTISPLPGFAGLTRQPFRGEFSAFSKNTETQFRILKSDYRLSAGKFFAENLKLENEFYRIEAGGNLNLTENRLEVKGDCSVKGRFAEELISRVRDIDVLTSGSGEIQIPFSFNGSAAEFKPAADLFYIVNRLIQVRGEQLASRGIQKLNAFLEGIRQ